MTINMKDINFSPGLDKTELSSVDSDGSFRKSKLNLTLLSDQPTKVPYLILTERQRVDRSLISQFGRKAVQSPNEDLRTQLKESKETRRLQSYENYK